MSLGLAAHIAKQPGLLDDATSGHALFERLMAVNPNIEVYPVSYTHLDVYKRQPSGELEGRAPAP